jgi:hypothetical protein
VAEFPKERRKRAKIRRNSKVFQVTITLRGPIKNKMAYQHHAPTTLVSFSFKIGGILRTQGIAATINARVALGWD